MRALTFILIGITVITSISAFNNKQLQSRWIFNPYLVNVNKQYYRFFSSGFIHADYIHLVFNMIALYYFGRTIEFIFTMNHGVLGKVYFLLLYLGGVIVSDVPSFIKHRNNPGFNSLGASGGVASVLFGSILYRPLVDLCIYGIICIPAFILGTLYLIYSYFSGKQMADNINHDAHLFGALYGIVFTIALNPPVVIGFFNEIKEFSLF